MSYFLSVSKGISCGREMSSLLLRILPLCYQFSGRNTIQSYKGMHSWIIVFKMSYVCVMNCIDTRYDYSMSVSSMCFPFTDVILLKMEECVSHLSLNNISKQQKRLHTSHYHHPYPVQGVNNIRGQHRRYRTQSQTSETSSSDSSDCDVQMPFRTMMPNYRTGFNKV